MLSTPRRRLAWPTPGADMEKPRRYRFERAGLGVTDPCAGRVLPAFSRDMRPCRSRWIARFSMSGAAGHQRGHASRRRIPDGERIAFGSFRRRCAKAGTPSMNGRSDQPTVASPALRSQGVRSGGVMPPSRFVLRSVARSSGGSSGAGRFVAPTGARSERRRRACEP